MTTNQDEWRCETVVVATGAFNVPHRPSLVGRSAIVGDNLDSV